MAAAQSPPLVSKTIPLRTLCSLSLINRIISCLVNSSIPASHPPFAHSRHQLINLVGFSWGSSDEDVSVIADIYQGSEHTNSSARATRLAARGRCVAFWAWKRQLTSLCEKIG